MGGTIDQSIEGKILAVGEHASLSIRSDGEGSFDIKKHSSG